MIIQGKSIEPNSMNMSVNSKKLFHKNYTYIPILKNAHRLTTSILLKNGFVFNDSSSTTDLQNKIKLVVLRDPLARWYSGISQFLTIKIPNLKLNEEIVDLLTSVVVFDGHTRAQTNYLSGVNTDECIFFNMDDPLYENQLIHFCSTTFNKQIRTFDIGSYSSGMTKVKDDLQKYITVKYKKRIIDYYKEDYELFKTVKFYNGESFFKISMNQRKNL